MNEMATFNCSKRDNLVDYIKENSKPNDLILTLGAGTVTNIGPKLLNK